MGQDLISTMPTLNRLQADTVCHASYMNNITGTGKTLAWTIKSFLFAVKMTSRTQFKPGMHVKGATSQEHSHHGSGTNGAAG